MAKIFLDANIFIDLVENRSQLSINDLDNHDIFISVLSLHILMYVAKRKIPYEKLTNTLDMFLIVDFDQVIYYKSLAGPTSDFEDNVQLHSAASAECDMFITGDKQLLNLKFFGKTQIAQSL